MKLPSKTWEPITDWAVRNGWTAAEARERALENNEIEWNNIWREEVRWVPETRQPPKYVKISKSDR